MERMKSTWMKRAIQLTLAVVLVVGSGATFASAANVVKVKSVVLDQMAITIDPGTSAQLGATVFPRKATNQKLTWSSSNAKVLKVSNSGKVTAVKNGVATITVLTVDGKKKDTVNVKVANQSATIKSLAKQFIQAGVELNPSAFLAMTETSAWTGVGGQDFLNFFEGNLPGQFLDFMTAHNQDSTYDIQSVMMNGLTAKVKVSSTFVDGAQFLGSLYVNTMLELLNESGGSAMMDGVSIEKFASKLGEAITNQRGTFKGKQTTEVYQLTLRQENGVWRISDVPIAFMNSVMCNFMKSMSSGVEG